MKERKWSWLGAAVAVLLVVAVAVEAGAQQPPRRGGGRQFGGGPTNLLSNEAVQQDLDLLPDQIAKIEEANAARREAFGGGGQNLSREERQAQFQEANEAYQTAIDSILSDGQKKRLDQIALQQRVQRGGIAGAFTSPEVSEALGLSEDDLAALREKARELEQELREKAAKDRAAAVETLMKELSSDQTAAYKGLLGEPFDVSQLGGGFGAGGPGGGRFGGQGGQGGRFGAQGGQGGRRGGQGGNARPQN